MATDIDMRLGQASSDAEIMMMLASDDSLEIGLRRLAAYVYESRTHDRTGARAMLAIAPPGGNSDIAPSWLVDNATTHSRVEYQRSERVSAAAGKGGRGRYRGDSHEDGDGGDGGRGRGRGRDRGRGRGRKGRDGRPPDGGKA